MAETTDLVRHDCGNVICQLRNRCRMMAMLTAGAAQKTRLYLMATGVPQTPAVGLGGIAPGIR